MIKRFLLSAVLFILPLWAHADWAADRDASAGYVTVTTLATAIDEAVPFCVVYLSDMPADFWTAMDAASDTDGKTIRVSTSDGTTQLACVPIGVNTSTDTGCLIFLGTGMSASVDVDYRIYVGNASLSMPSASGGMGEQAVFAAYAGVYFPGVSTRDWTSGGRTLTATNSPGTTASGYEGITAATYAAASSQYHSYDGTLGVSGWPLTLEGLTYTTSATTNQRTITVCMQASTNSTFFHQYAGGVTNDPSRASGIGGSGSSTSFAAVNNYTTSAFHSMCITRDANSGTSWSYIDGASGSNTTTLLTPTAFNRFIIGARKDSSGTSEYLDGRVAVALLSSSVRSANYVSTMQDNWAGTMYSAGAWTALDSCTDGSTGWVLLQTASQSSTADADWANITYPLTDDANAATSSLPDGDLTEKLYLTNPDYGTTIPTGATYTVSVRIKKTSTGGAGRRAVDALVRYLDDTGTEIGDNVGDVSTFWTSSATSVDYVITGHAFDGTEFDADGGVVIQADGVDQSGTETASILAVWVKIDWDCGDSAATTRGFFALTE